ncbi:MAG TPA: DEAD/DEAH box helicase [Micromonosporaceae bacterium]
MTLAAARDSLASAPDDRTTAPPTTFADLGVSRRLTDTLRRSDITVPFPIQTATIPDAIAGRDVLARGRTGSGKTLAFGLPVIMRLANARKAAPHMPAALVLVPTRELAMQVNDAIAPLARAVGLFSRTAFGGTPYEKQIRDLRRGVDILVATPGRLGDLIRRGECSLAGVNVTVLDEADQMADMGFLPEVTALLDQTPAEGQRLLFSATLDGDVDALVNRFLHDPATHAVDPPAAAVSTMEHHLLLISPRQKTEIVASIAARDGRTIMFVRTQAAVDRLADDLAAVGVPAGALHGGKTQRVRTRTLAEFREGRVSVLVATDVAARGIHVDGVSLVVHVDPPKDAKDYLHRAGRTARAGEAGTVATLVMPKQRRSTSTMLQRAGVEPATTEVRLGASELAEVTGARRPSGVPVRHEAGPRANVGSRANAGPRASADRPGRDSDRRFRPTHGEGGRREASRDRDRHVRSSYGERGYREPSRERDRPARPMHGERTHREPGRRVEPPHRGGRGTHGDRPFRSVREERAMHRHDDRRKSWTRHDDRPGRGRRARFDRPAQDG